MWKFPFVSVLALAFFCLLGCEVRDHAEEGGGEQAAGGAQEEFAPQQQVSPQSPPAPTPNPKPAPYPKPKAADPEDAGHHPSDEADTSSGSDIESDSAETVDEPESEEDWGGCGMAAECVVDEDCVPDDPNLVESWSSYDCTDGMCYVTPITYTFDQQGGSDEDDYLRTWARTSSGYWEQKDYKLPVELPLEQLCQPLKKSNYSTAFGQSLQYRQLFAIVSLNKYQDVYGWHSLLGQTALTNFNETSYEDGFTVLSISMGGSIGPSVGYLENLGYYCTTFGQGPSEYFSY
jgi:hypothetical protein